MLQICTIFSSSQYNCTDCTTAYEFQLYAGLKYVRLCTTVSGWGISTAAERDGRRNDPRPHAPYHYHSAAGSPGRKLTLPPRSSAGQLCPCSARTPRNYTRARSSGRNRRPACAHGRERKEAPKIETNGSCGVSVGSSQQVQGVPYHTNHFTAQRLSQDPDIRS